MPRSQILCTTDKHVRHDLEMDELPPIELLHEYANEYILQMDCEDELTADMTEDGRAHPTVKSERNNVLHRIIKLQNIICTVVDN